MEFLVQFTVTVPEGTPASVVSERQAAEAVAAAELVRAGHLLRLWVPPLNPGESKILGLYRADSEAQLTHLMEALPLYEWMELAITPLRRHPNDPRR